MHSVVRAGTIEDAPPIIANVLMYVRNVGHRAPKTELVARQPNGTPSGVGILVAPAVPSAAA